MVVAFRRHTLLPLDDCLYALQPSIPHLTRSALHRCLQRHGISRLPDVDGDKPKRQRFKRYPIGFFHIDIAEVQTAEGKLYLFVAIDRTSKFAFVRLVHKAGKMAAAQFLRDLIAAVPYRLHKVLTDVLWHTVRKPELRHDRLRAHLWPRVPRAWDRAQADEGKASLDERPSRADEPHDQRGNRQALPLRQSRSTANAPRRLHRSL